ncbi:hypothetical protein CVT26_010509 [Gymnopilus dilepis]|uniref:Uncharacterized protein n=1 Tax=Gymnopilus dilepis TaxID=231916 RepID=A0A409Y0C8_9AGAR|nr:hypothetical protein CVT26_010509 [Gymnopilus dilepis]
MSSRKHNITQRAVSPDLLPYKWIADDNNAASNGIGPFPPPHAQQQPPPPRPLDRRLLPPTPKHIHGLRHRHRPRHRRESIEQVLIEQGRWQRAERACGAHRRPGGPARRVGGEPRREQQVIGYV